MSTQQRTKKRASTKGPKTEKKKLENAYIFPKEVGDNMIKALGELPSKYYRTFVGPMLKEFQNTYRGTIEANVLIPTKAPVEEKPKEKK